MQAVAWTVATALGVLGTSLPVAAAGEQGLGLGELLAGRHVAIDPGHGGFDPGARGLRAREDRINLEVALALARWFRAAGATVTMTWSRPGQIPARKKFRVQQRLPLINASGAQVLIDIHCNSGGASWHGPQTFYWDGNASYHLARDVQEELQYFTGTRRQIARIDQYVLRHAAMPAINVEVGFITNPEEERLLLDPAYQRRLTWAIFLGTERWFLHAHWPPALTQAPPPMPLLRR
jgi:N-acetylmuramoyl-L-alanine amidase